jgi:hypothetical protein
MTKIEIIERVKVLLEEVSPFDDGLQVLNEDVHPIQSYIENSIMPALEQLLLACPLHLTTAVEFATEEEIDDIMSMIESGTRNIGRIDIPEDFLRLHTIKIDNWEKSVHRAISIESPEYALQQNLYTRGGASKPVVVKKTGRLELYTVGVDDIIEEATYIQRPDIENLNLNQKLFEPACYMIASEVLSIFGSKQAEYMITKATELLKAEL